VAAGLIKSYEHPACGGANAKFPVQPSSFIPGSLE
jgi:hypothetical protein